MRDPVRSRQEQAAFRAGALAVSTRPVYKSYENTLRALAKEGGFDLLPLTKEKLDLIGGALKAADYRAAVNYLQL